MASARRRLATLLRVHARQRAQEAERQAVRPLFARATI
jgi:hypothetical protein